MNYSLVDLIDAVYDATNSHNERLLEEMTKISRHLVNNGKSMSELINTNKNLKRNLDNAYQENKKAQKQSESFFVKSIDAINNKLNNINDKLQSNVSGISGQSSSVDLSITSSIFDDNVKNLIASKEESLLIQRNWTQREIDLNNKKLENEVLFILSYLIL